MTLSKIWREQTTIKSLKRHFTEKIESSTSRGRDGINAKIFAKHLDENIAALYRKLRNGSYNFSAYRLILKSRGRGKTPREIALPSVRDRIVLRALAASVNEVIPECRMEKPHALIKRLVSALDSKAYTHYVKYDIKDFYPKIYHDWLFRVLDAKIRTGHVNNYLRAAVATPSIEDQEKHANEKNTRGVPQGLAVSNGLAELALQHLDSRLKRNSDVFYLRYVDDIIVLGDSMVVANVEKEILAELVKVGLSVHEDGEPGKAGAGLIDEGFEYLGYAFKPNLISVRESARRRIEARIAKIFTQYKYNVIKAGRDAASRRREVQSLRLHLQVAVSGFSYKGERIGWLAYYSQMRDQHLLIQLDRMIGKLCAKNDLRGIGMPSFQVEIKRAADRDSTRSGILNFDQYTLEEKRKFLCRWDPRISHWARSAPDRDIKERFARTMARLGREYERDLGEVY